MPKSHKREWYTKRRSLSSSKNRLSLSLHPLFVIVGLLYALQGHLFVFLMSCLVALQHELAHAFASAKLGYTMRKIVLMPFGALLQGDLSDISLKDEITVALYGPLCNLFTAFFFGALWWFYPTMYAFTDTAYYVSLSIAFVNLLPAYPLDGGRVFRAWLTQIFSKNNPDFARAERKGYTVCRIISILLGIALCIVGTVLFILKKGNVSLAVFGLFIAVSAPKPCPASSYEKLNFSQKNAFKKGVEVRRVAVANSRTLKDVFRFLESGKFLILDVYNEDETFAFSLSQNELCEVFLQVPNPYVSLYELQLEGKIAKNREKIG